MNKDEITQDSEKLLPELDFSELMILFKHIDETALKKENLFVGLSLSLYPAVIAGWARLNWQVVFLAAITSLVFYRYQILYVERYAHNQDKIFTAMEKYRNDFTYIISVPKELSIRLHRKRFYWLLSVFWVAIVIAKYLMDIIP